ncbi:MAG: gamma-glutamyltransferase [Methylococcales symbiont of Hymedesmia sp. n. MRB-2018]|nr:MAG: gamma-glutamyltransferase [Methylococcales symbiont of Hymedesmia sp. n. MRB-2018]KAF3982963.1 MAG: gamma-glutamyltransferase [Methylococcales symbiont of Hymedesmia sp. n. MRB-2018]
MFLKCVINFVLVLLLNVNVFASEQTKAAIATAHPLATQAGFEILQQGGNAFDAAVAISATLAVVEPSGSGLGGGGFWLLHRASDGFETMLDGREKAPLAARHNMFLDKQGDIIKDLSKNGVLAAGIPGLPAALVHLSEKYGQLSLAQSLKPAIHYAQNGFIIGERHRELLNFRLEVLKKNIQAAHIFLNDNKVPNNKSVLRQVDLANTLKQIAQFGKKGFYAGIVAKQLIESVSHADGIWSQQDLDNYQVVEREPIRGDYKGIKITSAALPSSGGIVLVEALNILAKYPLDEFDVIRRKHIISEALRRAYHDRALYLGDNDFVKVPVKQLLNKDYAAGLRASIRMDKATPSDYLSASVAAKSRGKNTTHFSIIDSKGNRVAATLSVNYPFGSGFIATGTGVLLNNEMDDFVSKVGEMNGYGLVGGVANAIEPGKRMLSSMSPTFIEDADRVAVLGTPGGSRIISMVLLAILDFAKGNSPESWLWEPRFHHQYIPDLIQYEKGGLTEYEVHGLTSLGHQLKEVRYRYGNMQAVQFNKTDNSYSAVSDPRGEGTALVR